MFICRHHLLRSYTPKHIAFSLSYGVETQVRNYSPPSQQYVGENTEAKKAGRGGRVPELARVDGRAVMSHGTAENTTSSTLPTIHGHGNTLKSLLNRWMTHPIPSFLDLHKHDVTQISTVPPGHLDRLIAVAAKHGRPDCIRLLAKDVVDHYHAGAERLQVLVSLLALSKHHEEPLLRKDDILAILQAIQRIGGLPSVPSDIIVAVAASTVSSYEESTTDVPLISILSPSIINLVHPSNGRIVHNHPTAPLWTLFAFVQRLSIHGEKKQALDLLKILMEQSLISRSSISSVDLTSSDFGRIVTLLLVNACLDRGWFAQANTILMEFLKRHGTSALPDDILHAIIRVVRGLLDHAVPTQSDIRVVASLVTRLLGCSFPFPKLSAVLDELLPLFYAQACTAKDGPTIEAIYALSRSRLIRQEHSFPAPKGPALSFLLGFSAKRSRNLQVVRLLAQQIVEEDVEVSHYDKASVISLLAAAGFAGPSRVLWERWTQRPGAQFIVGNATMMLRLVSLFDSLARRLKRNRSRGSSSRDGIIAGSASSDRKLAINDGFAQRISVFVETLAQRQLGRSGPSTRPHVGEDGSATDGVVLPYVEEPTFNAREVSHPQGSDRASTTTSQPYEDRVQDIQLFCHRVIAVYCKAKRPLHSASHFDLNALARAYFMIREYAAGWNTLMTLVSSPRHCPDIQDVNVALSGAAALHPAYGEMMLNLMIEVGLRPDAVSFGTVIHQAVLHRDVKLVTQLLTQARELHIDVLSFKTIGTLIRSAAQGSAASNAREDLDVVRDLVNAVLDANSIPTPRMGTDCVMAALRADDPVTAFRFWKEFVKGKVGWRSQRQEQLRFLIARQIRQHCLASKLGLHKGRVMLAELGQERGEEDLTSTVTARPPS